MRIKDIANTRVHYGYRDQLLWERNLMLEKSVRIYTGEDLRHYIDALTRVIREAGLNGSIHWQQEPMAN